MCYMMGAACSRAQSVVQMDEVRRLWRRVAKAESAWRAAACLTRGPGYYTAGQSTAGKIAQPGRGGDDHPEVFRLMPVDLYNDLGIPFPPFLPARFCQRH